VDDDDDDDERNRALDDMDIEGDGYVLVLPASCDCG
jgi:hypothetical protein